MVYSPSALRSKVTPNNFSGLRNDGNRIALMYGNVFQTQDGTGTPVTSPATVNTTQTLIVPTNAVQFVVISTTNPVQVSEDSTQSTFFTVPAGVIREFDCANQNNIYLKTGSSTAVSFYFNCI